MLERNPYVSGGGVELALSPGRQTQESPGGAGLLALNLVVALVQKKPDDSLNRRISPSLFILAI
jgi:hypothetical protein